MERKIDGELQKSTQYYHRLSAVTLVSALEYFFKLSGHQGQMWMYPGFSADRTNQPYFVVRQA